ncbi:hypothetical protein QTI17_02920 [Variovorax sp. J31P179]|uniref:hypothetical protein n=1 Tax=Variovorax sp. J31P179 TaxID=3053508 RepID=UPI0025753206|nr:hypothetical protein [Variovorax sp. J31P179]MDM0079534.1 hypothetical protein [Variovorax sp. J31P179]
MHPGAITANIGFLGSRGARRRHGRAVLEQQEWQRMRVSFNRHGPFYRWQRRVGLLTDTDLAAGRRAALFVAVGWIPALVLAAVQGFAIDAHPERAILFDYSAYAYAFAIVAFVSMEQSSDQRMAQLVGQFEDRGIVPPASRSGFAKARANMERRTGSWMAEGLILVLAYLLSWLWLTKAPMAAAGGTWHGRMVDGTLQPTLAGWWAMLVALPLYWFLLGRWLWRFVTWGLMLYEIARCDMRLVATHPDRCGGLAFMGQYPKTYVLFVLAESTVVSATVLKLVVHGDASLMGFKFALIGMIVFFAIAFVAPLAVFAPRLVALKHAGLAHYGSLASQHNIAFERKWISATRALPAEEMLGSPDPSSMADFAAGYDLIKRMLPVPVTLESVMPIVLAAVLPLICVAATQVPLAQVLEQVKTLLPV